MTQRNRMMLVFWTAAAAAVCKIVSYQVYATHKAQEVLDTIVINGVRYVKEQTPYELPYDLLATASMLLTLSCFILMVRPIRIQNASASKGLFRVILALELFDWAKEVVGLNNLNDGSQHTIFLITLFTTSIYSIYEYRYHKRND
jgi:hypothetical protein